MDFSLPSKLARQLEMFGRVVHALVLREARTRHGSTRIGYAWALVEPAIQLCVLWFFFELLGRRVPINASMPAFLLTGIFPYLAWRSASIRGATAVESNAPLMVHSQVQPVSIVTARVLLEMTSTLVIFLVFVVMLRLFGNEPLSSWTDEPLNLLGAFGAMSLLAFGFAMFNAGMARIIRFWPEVIRLSARVLFFTSGVFYTMESLPPQARAVILLNPLSHMIEWIRSAALPGFESDHYSILYVLGWAVWLTFCGLFMDWMLRLSGHAEAPG
ncbi:MAG: ABC transporter permease [Caulobacteraceae bacterium]|nr:ABC transporter permease [Caulobacteraceae bacterium]